MLKKAYNPVHNYKSTIEQIERQRCYISCSIKINESDPNEAIPAYNPAVLKLRQDDLEFEIFCLGRCYL